MSCCHFDGSLSLRQQPKCGRRFPHLRCCHFDGSLSLRPIRSAASLASTELLPFRWQPFIEALQSAHGRFSGLACCCHFDGSLSLRHKPGWLAPRFKPGCCHFDGSLSLRLLLNDACHGGNHPLLPFRWQPFIEAVKVLEDREVLFWLLPFRWQPFIEAGKSRGTRPPTTSCCHFDGSLSLRRGKTTVIRACLLSCCHFDGSLSLRPLGRTPIWCRIRKVAAISMAAFH